MSAPRPEVVRIICTKRHRAGKEAMVMPFIWDEDTGRWDTTLNHVGYAPAGPWPENPTQEWLYDAVRAAMSTGERDVYMRYDLTCATCGAKSIRVSDAVLQPWLTRAAEQGQEVIPVQALVLVIGSAREPDLPSS